MKIKRLFTYACLACAFTNQSLLAQMEEFFYLNSGFETLTDQAQWTSVKVGNSKVNWAYQKGGYTGSSNPAFAAQGSKNATLYFANTPLNKTLLISPELEMGAASRPILRFHHAMYNSITGTDVLQLLFRTGPTANWDTIVTYKTAVTSWTERIFDIRSLGTKYLTDHFQLAFYGRVGNGWGVCIDSVVVSETEAQNKFIKGSKIEPVSHKALPSGIDDIPVEKITLKVFGNTGNATLKSITVTPVGSGVSNLESTVFKLYKTSDIVFKTKENSVSTLLNTASLSGGKVKFTLSNNMSLGNNYYWIAVSVKDNLSDNSTFGLQFDANSISMNDTLFPDTITHANYYQKIYETPYFQNFENISGWTLQPDFEAAAPLGKTVGSYFDPDVAYSGSKILGTDLTGDGAYLTGITSSNAYFATMPELNLKYYINLGLFMQRQFSFGGNTNAVIQASNDGGTNWTTIWSNIQYPGAESIWRDYLDNYIDTLASHKERFQVRFGILENPYDIYPGFNVDNFAIIGTHLETDIGITRIISPYNDCAGCGNDTVIAVFKNNAEGNSPAKIPVFYGLNGLNNTLVYDTIDGPIAQDDSVIFKFSKLAGFVTGDIYDKFVVGVDLASDQDSRNDVITKYLILQNTNLPPHLNDFEYKGGLWQKSDGSTWECLNMTQTLGNDPNSPYVWVLSPTGAYSNDDGSYVESECYDLTQYSKHIVELKVYSQTEPLIDGARMEYTINDGKTWTIINGPSYSSGWGWYTDTVSSLGSKGWSGNLDWISARAFVPAAAEGHPKVKFRVHFASDSETNFSLGFAFDDFQVYPAPPDVGVTSIARPTSACQYVNPDTVDVVVSNYGFNTIGAGDTITVGVDFESQAPVIYNKILTSNLLPGNTITIPVPVQMNIDNPGTYDIMAYTLGEDDPYFYETNNDSLSTSFTIWANPVTLLPDSLMSRNPDTLYIEPYYQTGYTYLWQDGTVNQIYDVDLPGYHWVTVTEPTHSCKTTDTVLVLLLFNDVGIRSVTWPVSICELSSNEEVRVEFANMGTDSLLAGERVVLYYQVNGGATYQDTIFLAANLHAGKGIIHTFDERYNFSSIATYQIKAWSYYGGDSIAANNEVTRTIQVYGYTPLSLGGDKTVSGLSATLNAGAGFDTYTWSTGETTQSITITESGEYWVHAIDGNACPGDDTVNIRLKIRDVLPDSLYSPLSGCTRAGNEPVRLRIMNNGSDTITTANTLTASYRIGSGNLVQESFQPTINIVPGAYYIYTFNTTADVSAYQSFTFNLTATTSGDLRTANDTKLSTITTSANPPSNLGADRLISAPQVVLSAASGNYTYLWQDSKTTTNTFTASMTGRYWVIVSNASSGCYLKDSVFLTFDYTSIKLQNFTIPNAACSGNKRDVTVDLVNQGSVRAGADLVIAYEANDGAAVEENVSFTVDGGWQPKTVHTVTLQKSIPLNVIGTNTVKYYLIQTPEDTDPTDDELTKTIEVRQAPVDDWNNDTIYVDFPYQLDGGAGMASWQWQDGSSERYYTCLFPSEYNVTVAMGGNSCNTTKYRFVDQVDAINEAAQKNLRVDLYPNPAVDILNIKADLLTGNAFTIELIDITNHIVWSEKHKGFETYTNRLDVSDLPSGVYFLRFSNAEILRVDKIVVE